MASDESVGEVEAPGGGDWLPYRRCGLSVGQAAGWAAAGVSPHDAEAGVSLGLEPASRLLSQVVPGVTLPARAGWVLPRTRDTIRPAALEPGRRATITVSEIADLAGARRSIVSHWRKGKRHFPDPLLGGRSPQFDLAEVLRWMEDHGKLVNPPDGLWHWKRQVRSLPLVLGAKNHLPVRGLLAGLVATVALIGDPAPLGGTSPGRELARLAGRVEKDDPAWRGVVRPLAACVEASRSSPVLADLTAALLAALVEGSSPAGALDDALATLDDSGQGRTVTHVELAELMTSLLGARPGERVLDPACGEGQLLTRLSVQGRRSLELTGVELDPVAAAIARTRLLLRGLDATVDTGDALRNRFERPYDRVVVDPPLQERDAPAHLWLRLAVRQVASAGRAVVVTSVSSLGPNSVALQVVARHGGGVLVPSPAGLRSDARTGLVVWVLPGADHVHGQVLVAPPVVGGASSPTPTREAAERWHLAVQQWLERGALPTGDHRLDVRLQDVEDLVEAGVTPPSRAGRGPDAASPAVEAARRLAKELDALPSEGGTVAELREALQRFLADNDPARSRA